MMTIADLGLLSTAPQWRRRSVCRRRWPNFATLPTDRYWCVTAAVPYCGCILIPLLPVGWRLVVGGRSVGGRSEFSWEEKRIAPLIATPNGEVRK
jgi:hypothetical protein